MSVAGTPELADWGTGVGEQPPEGLPRDAALDDVAFLSSRSPSFKKGSGNRGKAVLLGAVLLSLLAGFIAAPAIIQHRLRAGRIDALLHDMIAEQQFFSEAHELVSDEAWKLKRAVADISTARRRSGLVTEQAERNVIIAASKTRGAILAESEALRRWAVVAMNLLGTYGDAEVVREALHTYNERTFLERISTVLDRAKALYETERMYVTLIERETPTSSDTSPRCLEAEEKVKQQRRELANALERLAPALSSKDDSSVSGILQDLASTERLIRRRLHQ